MTEESPLYCVGCQRFHVPTEEGSYSFTAEDYFATFPQETDFDMGICDADLELIATSKKVKASHNPEEDTVDDEQATDLIKLFSQRCYDLDLNTEAARGDYFATIGELEHISSLPEEEQKGLIAELFARSL